MPQNPHELSVEIDTIIKTIIPNILGKSIKSISESEVDRDLEFEQNDFAGVIGIYSDSLRGTLVLAMTIGSAEATNPMGQGTPEDKTLTEDWVGEATNLLAGQMRKSLERLHSRMSPPSVETNPVTVLSRYDDASQMNRHWFTIGADKICCQFTWNLEES